MRCARRTLVVALLATVGVAFAWTNCAAAAPTIWSGLNFTFTRSDDLDSSLPLNQDRVTPEVWLTRSASQGIFNIAVENAYDQGVFLAPAKTLWATALNNPDVVDLPEDPIDGLTPQNWAKLSFAPWRVAYQGGSGMLPGHLLANRGVVKLDGASPMVDDDIYFDIQFNDWGIGGGPTFSYQRGSAPTTGDYNGDGLVNAADYTVWRNTLGEATTMRGGGADGDKSGFIDAADYSFWRDHYGVTVTGNGASLSGNAVPEPAAIVLALIGLFLFPSVAFRRYHKGRQPGWSA